MNSPKLYMPKIDRKFFLDRHNFYYEQLKTRIFTQFKNIEKEADEFFNKECVRLLNGRSTEDVDICEIEEAATEEATGYGTLLQDFKNNIYLSGLAGLYHQWEKDLRRFIKSELTCDISLPKKEKRGIWGIPISEIFEILKIYDWDIESEQFLQTLNAYHLILNVYKHGDGKSFNKLKIDHIKYLKNPFGNSTNIDFLGFEDLEISEQEFDELAEAIKQFWEAFPERSFISSQDNLDKLLAILK